MAVTEIISARPARTIATRIGGTRIARYPVGLLIALCVAAPLNLVALGREAYGNTYYAATVKSMLTSWHNFFFVSFDAGGFVSADKPPLGLWIQAASAKLFGFNGLSLLVPQALAGIAAVALLYHLVARVYGATAGLIAALTLAVTPITVVTDRNNTGDGVLVLILLSAAWAVSVAAESGRLGPLLLGAALVGLGFNVKMLQAYLVLPPLVLLALVGAPIPWRKRLGQLLAATAVLLVVSLAWVAAVDLTPASARPYVGSSGTNSALSLVLGYNGLSRLTDTFFTRFPGLRLFNVPIDLDVAPAFAPGIGEPDALRLLNQGLAGQIGWLLPLAVIGLVVAGMQAAREPDGARRVRQWQAIALWGGWLATVGGFFSVARFFHPYYLIMLGPAIAALVGIGCTTLFRWYRAGGWRAALLPAALLAAAAAQAHILSAYPGWNGWLTPAITTGCLIAATTLAIARFRPRPQPQVAMAAFAVGLLALLLAPTVWSAVSVRDGNGGAWIPQAGPQTTLFRGGAPRGAPGRPNTGTTNPANGQQRQQFPTPAQGRGGFGSGAMTFAGSQWNSLDPGLVEYLLANQGDARYLVATTTSSYASLFILTTDQPALALGGYQGWDRIVTPAALQQMVRAGAVRFFYLNANGPSGGFSTATDATADLTQWVRTACTAVPASQWQAASGQPRGPSGGFGQANQLYDCAGWTAGQQ